MNWDAIAAISQVVAAIGVIISLIHLAAQIRNNTREVRSASFNAVTEAFNQFNLLVGQNAEVASLILRGWNDYGQLDGVEELRFDLLMLGLFRVHESVFYQSNRGTMERDLRDAENRSLVSLLSQPGVRDWWHDNPYSLTLEFRAHIERLVEQAGSLNPASVSQDL